MNTASTLRRIAAICLVATLATACSDDDDSPDVRQVVGTALSVLNDSVQAQRDFVVFDLEQPADAAPVASGKSDDNGQFTFTLLAAINKIFVVFPPVTASSEPRSSGLFSLGETGNGKALKDDTDLACQAGVTAVRTGAITAAQLTDARIENLEAAARIEIDEDGVDFTNPDSVAAAVADIRAATNDGANPPPAR